MRDGDERARPQPATGLRAFWNVAIVPAWPVLVPAVLLAVALPLLTPPRTEWSDAVNLAKAVFSGGLVSLLGVAAIYRRRRMGGDIGRIDRLAHAFRLGGTFALRPFIRAGMASPSPDATLAEYRQSLEEPEFVQLPWVLGYLLCVVTVFVVSWVFMFDLPLENDKLHTLLLGGNRLLADVCVAEGGASNPCWADPTSPIAVGAWKQPLGVATVRYMTEAVFWVDLAFLGAYLWSMVYLVWRMAVLDLTGHAFNVITVRVVASGILAILFHHLYWRLDLAHETASVAGAAGSPADVITRLDAWLLIPIACGLMPERVLRKLTDLARSLLTLGSRSLDLPLEDIDGIDDRYRARLAEVGIDDAHALAAANPIRLTMVTPFSFPQILAWIDQAILMVRVGPLAFRALHDRGLRGASALLARDHLPTLPDGLGSTVELDAVKADLRADPAWRRLAEILDRFPKPATP
jgi:hypothetical protein